MSVCVYVYVCVRARAAEARVPPDCTHPFLWLVNVFFFSPEKKRRVEEEMMCFSKILN